MTQPKLWERILGPHIQRFRTAAAFNMQVIHDPVASAEMAKLLTGIQTVLDAATDRALAWNADQSLVRPSTTWQHTESGKQYFILGHVLNTITDKYDVLYCDPMTSEVFTRQLDALAKAFLSTNEQGKPRFVQINMVQ